MDFFAIFALEVQQAMHNWAYFFLFTIVIHFSCLVYDLSNLVSRGSKIILSHHRAIICWATIKKASWKWSDTKQYTLRKLKASGNEWWWYYICTSIYSEVTRYDIYSLYILVHMWYHHHSFPDDDYSLVETSK
jgi:hypothetical protein